MSELDDLRARVLLLEQENQTLKIETREKPRRRPVGRSIVAGIVLAVAVLLAPIAAMGTWARLQLVDADRFVATFAPLAEDPDVQDFVAAQASAAIQEQVDLTAVVGEVFDGLRELDLPPRAASALTLLEAPAASGLTSLVDGVIHDVVASDQFADIWAQSLRFTHERAVAIMQNSPDTALQLADDGVLSIDLGLVVERVKSVLTERGVGFADLIPEIDRSIPIAQADALVLVRTVYQIAVAAGFWLPWVVLGLVVAGILIARNRPRALFWTSAAFAVAFLLLSAGMGIGRTFFIGAVSPSIMTSAAAQALFDEVTSLLSSTIVALAMVGVLIAVWAWLAGSSRSARAARGILDSGFSAVRGTWERRGLSTGRFGLAVERFHGPIVIVGMALALLVLIVTRPVSFGSVIGVTIGLIVFMILIELLRRPTAVAAPPEEPGTPETDGVGIETADPESPVVTAAS
ncbi:hypothetical protein HCX50_05090 [Microbacterium oxydans]|uniref:hypothetical protein n=1 Tax=Microbacterium sp. B19(2022) TaxID=2914045 RepID=UPI0014318BBD|nr:hypothetical protein [Microbacterium sp. B19(2022)]NJI58798.1 hypothetical protein [Microbacterium sp. B19(2022)]